MNYVINIGRQLGSGGRVIGRKLADRFGFAYYDKELIGLASKESGLGKEFFEKVDERKGLRFLSNLFASNATLCSENYSNNVLNRDSLFKIQSDVIRHLAEQQSCVFIGRCADYVLRDNPRCLNVFLTADEEDRIRRIREVEQITEAEARAKIEQVDKKRSAYYNYYTGKDWGHSVSYHLCLNSSVLGEDGTVETIREFAEKMLGL